jgi:hypothetical protein
MFAFGCHPPADPDPPEVSKPDPMFETLVRDAARDYRAWGQANGVQNWAPLYCEAPRPALPPSFSASADTDTHGQKLYSLFVKHRIEYLGLGEAKVATVGQVIVKEAWLPERVEGAEIIPAKDGMSLDFQGRRLVRKGDQVYQASKPAGLFVMLKLDPQTPETDAGWVYGTVSPDGKTVTSAGRVESCMKCHQTARHDRLFGLTAKQ